MSPGSPPPDSDRATTERADEEGGTEPAGLHGDTGASALADEAASATTRAAAVTGRGRRACREVGFTTRVAEVLP